VIATSPILEANIGDLDIDEAYELIKDIKKDEERNPFYHWTPLSTQKKFLDCPVRNKWLFGGNQAGKTTSGVYFVIRDCLEHPGHQWWAGAESWDVSRIIQQAKFNEMLPLDEIEYAHWNSELGFRHHIIKFKNKSQISFRTYDQERRRWQGATLHGILLDEEPPWDIYQECLARIAKHVGWILGTMTSLNGYTRLVEEIMMGSKSGIKCFFISTYENVVDNGGALTKQAIATLEDGIEEKDREARIAGIPTQKTGLVLSGLSDGPPFIIPYEQDNAFRKEYPTICSIDPHPAIPHAVLWTQIDPSGHLWIRKERPWLIKEGSFERVPWVDIKKFAFELNTSCRGTYITNMIIDKQGCHQGNAINGKSIQEALVDENIFTTDAGGEVDDKIVLAQQYIRLKKIHIHESCWNLRWELKRYIWQGYNSSKISEMKEQRQRPRKKDDHLIDCMLNTILYIETVGMALPEYHGPMVRNPERSEVVEEKSIHKRSTAFNEENVMEMYQ